jgi:hypothetical protein
MPMGAASCLPDSFDGPVVPGLPRAYAHHETGVAQRRKVSFQRSRRDLESLL